MRPNLVLLMLAAMEMAGGTANPRTEPKVTPPDGETFHGHLDKCVRCRERPFGMCPIGNALLEREATAT